MGGAQDGRCMSRRRGGSELAEISLVRVTLGGVADQGPSVVALPDDLIR